MARYFSEISADDLLVMLLLRKYSGCEDEPCSGCEVAQTVFCHEARAGLSLVLFGL